MGFIGVDTGGSSIMRVFPEWARILDLPTDRLVGHDLPVGASDDAYVQLVERIRDDPEHRGALVTTHKMALYGAAHHLFDSLDPFAVACGEVSSIAVRDGRLLGHAKDPLTAALALDDVLPPDHFATTGATALVLGAGGAGTALTWSLQERLDRPARTVVTDTSAERLAHLRSVHERRGTDEGAIEYVRVGSPEASRDLLAETPPRSLVVNASGLGKDRPGSPLPADAVFPENAVVWEFNYRGTLEFLAQARAQEDERGLTVVDGWRYFIHGWSQVIAEVFDIDLTPELVERLADAAAAVR
ncbi:shikimate dehydrogenase [Labedella endophytica]|uniref:Shikimate dehydrogenase n=2 Tax=Labedella endophytica TaxID=1523160 RepID=A0A433JV14_9MICO|nr:shikimate dehydrogenase [Labedella endophytica]